MLLFLIYRLARGLPRLSFQVQVGPSGRHRTDHLNHSLLFCNYVQRRNWTHPTDAIARTSHLIGQALLLSLSLQAEHFRLMSVELDLEDVLTVRGGIRYLVAPCGATSQMHAPEAHPHLCCTGGERGE